MLIGSLYFPFHAISCGVRRGWVREVGRRFRRCGLLGGRVRLRWDEFAFAGGFEDGGAVAFEIGLHAPQARDSRLQPRELFLDFRDDLALFVRGGIGTREAFYRF